MTDASNEDFVKGLQKQFGEPGHDNSHPNAQTWSGLGSSLLGATSATVSGLGKGIVNSVENSPLGSIPNDDGRSPVMNWAKSENKDYPVAEKAGRYAAEYAPLALLPELGGVRVASKIIPELPRVARVLGKGVEGAWKGAAGGAAEANVDTPSGDEAGRRVARGAAEGAGTTVALGAGQAALRAMPYWVLPAAIAGGELMHGRFLPWHIRHAMGMAHPLALLAAAAMGKFPGVTGALGAKEFGDDGGKPQKRPEPF